MGEPWITYELWQNDVCVAAASGPDREQAHAEIMHYAMQYAQDGPCEVRGPRVDQEFADDFDGDQ